jgi:tryptophan synthase alpha chain
MGRIDEKFQEGKKALIAFIVAGDPNRGTCLKIAETIIDAGADMLELGVPFSDPIADGPTIQKADERALKAGTNLDVVLDIAREIRSYSDVPIILLIYYNNLIQNIEKFYRDAHGLVDGVLIVDMPFEESEEVRKVSKRYGIDQIFLVAQTTTDERLKKIVSSASGFLYLVSILGVTGAREKVSEAAIALIRHVRLHTDLPLAVGFGISRPEHVEEVIAAGADAAIVGSAIVNIIERNLGDERAMIREIHDYIDEMSDATG